MWVQRVIVFGILLAPSIWMLARIPPLWRDLDAYIQVTRSPASAAYMGHGPLYGIFARGPLFAGAIFERQPGEPLSLAKPRLTDSGVALLIVTQHLLLAGAAFALIALASGRFGVRLFLALAWASIPLFPTFAHCVGSESLSIILVLALAAAGLSIVKSREEPTGRAWLWFGALLWLVLLVRHVNLLLAFALPIALFAMTLRHRTRRRLNQAVVATAVSAICIVLAQASLQKLCRLENLRYHSRIGFTFLWRLPFLTALPQEAQHKVLAKIAARPMSDDAQKLVVMLREMLDEGSPLQAGDLIPRVRTTLFPPGVRWSGDRFDAALNDLAIAFLRPPTREHRHAAFSDFKGALITPLPEPATSLFTTTAYYFANAESMPACAGLTTFRNWTAEQLVALPTEHPYLRAWSGVRYSVALIFAAVLALSLVVLRKRIGGLVFAACLVVIGVLMIASTCFIGGILPRYTLPMWETLLIALVICGGAIGDYIAGKFSRPAPAA
ncbi:MAG: hypothetical protein M3Y69_11050 [Verrucomicrobiota bacterium]|nr:hypothetical protein [Verrucomicrobiota bacterium]